MSFNRPSVELLRNALKRGKTRSSPGCDGWSLSELRMLPDAALDEFGHMARLCECKQKLACQPQQLRPITVLPMTWRWLMKVRSRQISDWIDSELHAWQTGARPGRSIAHAVAETTQILEAASLGFTGPVFGFTLDIRKCFDSIPWVAVECLLAHHGL
eukprot:238026-Amphidinium_carterae.2